MFVSSFFLSVFYVIDDVFVCVCSVVVYAVPVGVWFVQQKMDGHSELGFAENFDPGIIGRLRDDESKSGSDNFEGASGDDQDGGGGDQPPRKKKYHRHTPNQIQELEKYVFFPLKFLILSKSTFLWCFIWDCWT